jgi:hypothetical protein
MCIRSAPCTSTSCCNIIYLMLYLSFLFSHVKGDVCNVPSNWAKYLLLYCHIQVPVSNGCNWRLSCNLLLTPLQLHNAQIIPGANIPISLYFILILPIPLITYCIDIVSTKFLDVCINSANLFILFV